MDIRTNNNRIYSGSRRGALSVLISATTSLLGALCMTLSGAPVFAGIAAAVILAIVFITVRGPVRTFMIVIPSLAFMMMTGNVSVPALYLGFVFTFAFSLCMTEKRRWLVPICVGAVAYAITALIFDPLTALLVFFPIVLGMIARMALPTYGIAPAVGILTLLCASGAVLAVSAGGIDLEAIGEELREYIAGVYLGASNESNEMIIIDERSAQMLASMMVNMLPGIVIAAVELMIWVGCKLALALIDGMGTENPDFPESARRIELSPVSGIVYVLAFLFSSAFAIEGRGYEMAGAVTDNLLIILAPVFIAFGLRISRDRLARKLSRFEIRPTERPRKAANGATAVTCLMLPGVSLLIYLVLGVIYTFSPLLDAVKRKIKEASPDDNDDIR